jgi:hypothetical protein
MVSGGTFKVKSKIRSWTMEAKYKSVRRRYKRLAQKEIRRKLKREVINYE